MENEEGVNRYVKKMNTEHGYLFANVRRKLRRTGISLLALVLLLSGQVCAETETLEKEETVCVIAGPSGNADKIIVSDWLKNAAKGETVDDETILSQIENLKGEET